MSEFPLERYEDQIGEVEKAVPAGKDKLPDTPRVETLRGDVKKAVNDPIAGADYDGFEDLDDADWDE